MSMETSEWLNRNILIGFTEKRGRAWHYKQSDQGAEPNHYPTAVPMDDVLRRLFHWTAVEQPVFIEVGGHYLQVPNKKAITASDDQTVLGIFSDGYQPHQYDEWLLKNVATLLDDTIQIGSAGLLRNRGVAFVSVEVSENIKTPEGVEFRPNLVAATSFDGTLATTYKRCVTNVVCDNTLAASLHGEKGQQFKFRHSLNSLNRIKDAREALGILYQTADDFAAEVAELTNTTVTDAQWGKLLDATVPMPDEPGRSRTMAENKRNELQRLFTADERVAPWTNTAFGVLQAFNTYGAHMSIVRGRGGVTPNRVERNLLADISGRREQDDAQVMSQLSEVLAA